MLAYLFFGIAAACVVIYVEMRRPLVTAHSFRRDYHRAEYDGGKVALLAVAAFLLWLLVLPAVLTAHLAHRRTPR